MGLFDHVPGILTGAATGNPEGLTSLWGDISGANQQYDIAMKNLEFSRENFEYQKGIQRTIFNREDKAVQRRAADLKKAGLSPVLAAGSAAQSGPVVKTDAPHADPVRGPNLAEAAGMAQGFMNLAKMKADISSTYAQKNLIDMQKNDVFQSVKAKKLDNILRRYDVSNAKLSGIGNPKSFVGKIGKDIAGTATKSVPALLLQQLLQKLAEEKPVPQATTIKPFVPHRTDNKH